MVAALEGGATVVGAAPSYDTDPAAQIRRVVGDAPAYLSFDIDALDPADAFDVAPRWASYGLGELSLAPNGFLKTGLYRILRADSGAAALDLTRRHVGPGLLDGCRALYRREDAGSGGAGRFRGGNGGLRRRQLPGGRVDGRVPDLIGTEGAACAALEARLPVARRWFVQAGRLARRECAHGGAVAGSTLIACSFTSVRLLSEISSKPLPTVRLSV